MEVMDTNQLAFGHADGIVLGGASAAMALGSTGGSFPGPVSPILVLRVMDVVESCLSSWGSSTSPSVDTALERAGTKYETSSPSNGLAVVPGVALAV